MDASPSPLSLARQATRECKQKLLELQADHARLEDRYQQLVAQFYHAQIAYEMQQQQCERLQATTRTKQRALETLLQQHPQVLSAELQAAFDLPCSLVA